MSIYQPYTYHIVWTALDKHYYGVRYKKNCNPSDFWVSYFTSSKCVKKFRNIYGEPDVIEIRKIFETGEEALNWEQRVLKKLKIMTNEKWLNASIGKPSMGGKKHSPETIIKMKKPKPHGFGEKIRKFQKSRLKTLKHRENLKLSHLGKILSKESIKKRTATFKERFEQGLYNNLGASRLGKKRGPYKKRSEINNTGTSRLGKKRGPYKKRQKHEQ